MRTLVSALVLLTSATVSSQPEWRPATGETAVSVDLLTAIGAEVSELAIDEQGNAIGRNRYRDYPLVLVLGGRFSIGDAWGARVEFPVAALRRTGEVAVYASTPDLRGTDTALGNPYLGLTWAPSPTVSVEGGLRLPLARGEDATSQPDATFAGLEADYERFEAYLADVLTVRGTVEVRPRLSSAPTLRLRASPSVYVDTCGEGCRDRSDVGLAASAHLTTALGAWVVEGGLLTHQFYSGLQDDGYGYQFFATDAALALSASVEVGGVRPGLSVRAPVSTVDVFGFGTSIDADGNRFADASLGLSLDVPLR